MTVRPAVPSDIPSLVRLHKLLHEVHLRAEPRYFKPASPEEVEALFQNRLSKEETRGFVAAEAESAAGYLLGAFGERKEDAFFRSQQWFQIDQICVDPSYQRHGHGRSLVAAAVECARAAGIQQVQTGVWAFNDPSLALFNDQGFRASEHRLRMIID